MINELHLNVLSFLLSLMYKFRNETENINAATSMLTISLLSIKYLAVIISFVDYKNSINRK